MNDQDLPAPPDTEWRLGCADYQAVVTAVGATVRSLTHQGRDLIVPFGPDQVRPLYRGALVAPWPNRIADGRYPFGGKNYQLPINEVERGHALHGLVHWVRWEPDEVKAERLVLRHRLVPQDGYPFPLLLEVAYHLDARGLHTRLRVTNLGESAAPYGCCPHPYLVAGSAPLDTWLLTVPAGQRLEVDDRLLPTYLAPVTDVDCDFRQPALVGNREIDHAFTEVQPTRGRVTVRLEDPAQHTGVELSWGSWAPWVQIHTADRPEPENNRLGLAVEPMNCPPDAFNLPIGVPVLQPRATHEAEWTIAALPSPVRHDPPAVRPTGSMPAHPDGVDPLVKTGPVIPGA